MTPQDSTSLIKASASSLTNSGFNEEHRKTRRLQTHLDPLCLCTKNNLNKRFFSRVRTIKCLFEEMETTVLSQRAEIPAVFALDHAPVPDLPPHINIKVCPLKERLGKYILELSVTSLSRHQLEDDKTERQQRFSRLRMRSWNLRTKAPTMVNVTELPGSSGAELGTVTSSCFQCEMLLYYGFSGHERSTLCCSWSLMLGFSQAGDKCVC